MPGTTETGRRRAGRPGGATAEKPVPPRLRRACALSATFDERGLKVGNFLTQRAFRCSPALLGLLLAASDWASEEDLAGGAGVTFDENFSANVRKLVELGALVRERSDEALCDDEYRTEWRWGNTVGALHFLARATPNMPYQEQLDYAPVQELANADAGLTRPELFSKNDAETAIPLDTQELHGWLDIGYRRRSQRAFGSGPIDIGELSEILFAGMAITGFIDVPNRRELAVGMTPSPGARNPFEAYVHANRVGGLSRGFYHYSGAEHSLARIEGADANVRGSDLLAGQPWGDTAAATIYLVANFPRMNWKYLDPVAYLTTYTEAGHIGQNMLLAATALQLASVPTAAISQSALEQRIGTNPLDQFAAYAVLLGKPDSNQPSDFPFRINESLRIKH